MFEFIKDIFRKKELRKAGSSAQTELVPMKDIHSAAVLIDLGDECAEKCAEKAEDYFRKHGIKVSVWFLDMRKKTTSEKDGPVGGKSPAGKNIISRRDLNWFGRPSAEKTELMAGNGMDMFISLADNRSFPVRFIAKRCRARFKIGRKQFNDKTFDMVIGDSPSTEYNPEEAFGEITRYLDLIK